MSVALQTPGPPRREVTWGEGIVVAAFHSAGGLKVAVDHIHTVVGPYIGTRNTFAKLLRVEDPSVLAERDLFRAWLLLTALGEDAESWGISDGVVPNGHDPARLREELRACRDSNPKPSVLEFPGNHRLTLDLIPGGLRTEARPDRSSALLRAVS